MTIYESAQTFGKRLTGIVFSNSFVTNYQFNPSHNPTIRGQDQKAQETKTAF